MRLQLQFKNTAMFTFKQQSGRLWRTVNADVYFTWGHFSSGCGRNNSQMSVQNVISQAILKAWCSLNLPFSDPAITAFVQTKLLVWSTEDNGGTSGHPYKTRAQSSSFGTTERIPYRLEWQRTRVSAVRSQQLTAWVNRRSRHKLLANSEDLTTSFIK
jgi:hypothetical protein